MYTHTFNYKELESEVIMVENIFFLHNEKSTPYGGEILIYQYLLQGNQKCSIGFKFRNFLQRNEDLTASVQQKSL